jgi:hypothetical protein
MTSCGCWKSAILSNDKVHAPDTLTCMELKECQTRSDTAMERRETAELADRPFSA